MVSNDQATIDILLRSRGVSDVKQEAEEISAVYKRVKEAMDKALPSPKVRAAEYLDSLNSVKQILESTGPATSLDNLMKGGLASHMTGRGQIDVFENKDINKILDVSSTKSITDALDQVNQAIVKINSTKLNPVVKDETLGNFVKYRDLLIDANYRHEKLAGEGGAKIEGFLGRYKYALTLVGLALAGIYGMAKYSQTFGSALDVVGSALGYLADTLLYFLIPLSMMFAEIIIGLADYINQLPDPLKNALAGLALLGLGMALFGGTIMKAIGWIRNLIGSLGLLTAAGELTAAGLITGIIGGLIVGFAVVWAMVQTGVLNTIAKVGQTLLSQYPVLVDIVGAFLGPLGLLGIIVVDAVTGQFDKIPEHMRIAGQMTANYIVALGARILQFTTSLLAPVIGGMMKTVANVGMGIGAAISGIGKLGDAIHDSFNSGKMAVLGFIESFSKIPYIGDQFKEVSDWAAKAKEEMKADSALGNSWIDMGSGIEDYWKRFYDNSDLYVTQASDRWKELAETYEGYNKNAFKENLGEYNPGSIFNGLTTEDQLKALVEQQQKASGSSFADILAKYDKASGLKDYSSLYGSSSVNAATDTLTGSSGALNIAEKAIAERHLKAMADLQSHSKYQFDTYRNGSSAVASALPSSPAPVASQQGSIAPTQNIVNNTTQNYTISQDQKSARQIADEISKLWNTSTRSSRI